jgi:Ca-activated chloride channel family protein
MTFAWPAVLFLLGLPAAALAWEWARGRRAPDASGKMALPHVLRAEAGAGDLQLSQRPFRPRRPGLWLASGVACAIVALARPQWGQESEPMFDRSREILVAVDLSRSMLTADVAPSRLERSKLLIHSLLDRLAGERVGLVVFTGTAFLQAPMSADYEILREFLPQLSPDFLPDSGTNYGPMIATAASAFSTSSEADRFLIVLSDGGANDEHWQDQIPALIKKGVHVIALGVGTAAGGFIPDAHGGLVKDERGAVVLAKLESSSLKELADRTHGLYRDASDWVDVPVLVQSAIAAGKQGAFAEVKSVSRSERFQWALAPALILLGLSFWREVPVRPKPRALRWTAAAVLAAALGLRAANTPALPPQQLLGQIVGRLAGSAAAPSPQDWAELGQQTLTWGQAFANAQQPVPPGPVHDALDGVAQGRKLNPHAAEWSKLQSDLEALLQPPPGQKKEPDPPKPQNQQKDQQKKQQNGQSSDSNKSEEQKEQEQKQPNPGENSPGKGQSDPVQKPHDPAAGEPPPQPTASPKPDSQPVGGQPQNQRPDPARQDPALAGSLQKLDRVREQDSPAQLFQMLANQNPQKKAPPPQHPKNW